MSLSFSEMHALQKEISALLENSTFIRCFEWGMRQLVLCFRKDKKDYPLLMCFQEPFLRFHLLSHFPKGKKSLLSENLQQELANSFLTEVRLVSTDRILGLQFQCHSEMKTLLAEFFAKRPNLYLLDKEKKILCSLNPSSQEFYFSPTGHAQQTEDIATNSEKVEKEYLAREQAFFFIQKKKRIKDHLLQRIKRLQKTYNKQLEELNKCQKWSQVHEEALLLHANLFQITKGMTECSLVDWQKEGVIIQLTLDPTLAPAVEVEKRFRCAKKLKAGIKHHEKQVIAMTHQLAQWNSYLAVLETVTQEENLEAFIATHHLEESKEEKHTQKVLPYREFITQTGLRIWVGKNAKDNEKLTFHYGKGNDWWLHVSDYPGSHLVIKTPKNHLPDQESLQDAFQLALKYSKAKDKGSAEICVTQCKYVSRVGKGQVGKVAISSHKHYLVKVDLTRLKRLMG